MNVTTLIFFENETPVLGAYSILWVDLLFNNWRLKQFRRMEMGDFSIN